MWIGTSLATIVVGAIMRFGIHTQHTHGVNLSTIGLIILLAGIAGFVLALAGEMMARHRTVKREVSGPGGNYTERQTHNV